MTGNADFDRRIFDFLDREAGHGSPDYLADILGRTAHTRQRPAWSSIERWLPMDISAPRSVLNRPAPIRTPAILVVVALLIAAVAVVTVGTRRSTVQPFGLARNGSVVYGGSDGDIYAIDPATGASTAIVVGPKLDFAPYFSRDGSQFIFVTADRQTGPFVLMLANPDGTNARPISEPLDGLEWFSWSPDGSRVAIISGDEGAKSLSILGMDGTIAQITPDTIAAGFVQWLPSGRELMFRGVTTGSPATFGLYVIGATGEGLRAIIPPTNSDGHWQNPALSPDGTTIIYTQWDPAGPGHLWSVGVDGSGMQMLRFDGAIESDYFAVWSPDGSQIVFNRGRAQDKYFLAVAPAGGGHAVNIGPEMPWDAAAAAEFSPDGSKVIATYGNGEDWIFDVNGGPDLLLPESDFVGSWQRLAP